MELGGRHQGFPGAGFGADCAVAFVCFEGWFGGCLGACGGCGCGGLGCFFEVQIELDCVGYETAMAASRVGFGCHLFFFWVRDVLRIYIGRGDLGMMMVVDRR